MRRPHGDGYRNAHTGSCQFPLQQICGYNVAPTGWVTEWLIVHAWKACVPKGTGGSNPPPSARPWLGRPLTFLLLLLLLFLNASVKFRVSLLPVVPAAVSPRCRERGRRGSLHRDKPCSRGR